VREEAKLGVYGADSGTLPALSFKHFGSQKKQWELFSGGRRFRTVRLTTRRFLRFIAGRGRKRNPHGKVSVSQEGEWKGRWAEKGEGKR